ncbi:MAG TPA: M23 family metallopeptidase, partial [Candidatus Gracilibacteria bacterium]|nr:M23 family metallopeptidase [Candidatus Gracilibacteria bacterium]
SYIILAHAGGFMTVYGHVSELRVEAGEKVFAGQTIGLTGGTPGTKGAGVMTTGAHLHFEVMKGGKYVDPLDYLPLTLLPMDSLPEKYRNRITGEADKVRRNKEGDDPFSNDEQMTDFIETSGAIESAINGTYGETSPPDSSEDILRVETTP